MPYIYKTTNKITKYIYIGKSGKDNFDPTYYGSGNLLKRSIRKRGGTSHLTVELIEDCHENDVDAKEIQWIRHYKDANHKMYNIAKGGSGGDTCKYKTEEEKAAIYAKAQRTKIKNGSLCHSDETRAIMSKNSKIRIKNKPWTLPNNKGRIYSDKAYNNILAGNRKKRGHRTINNGIKETKLPPNAPLPSGWVYGRVPHVIEKLTSRIQSIEEKTKKSETMLGRKCYTNGNKNKWIYGDMTPPDGWWMGMTKKKVWKTKK